MRSETVSYILICSLQKVRKNEKELLKRMKEHSEPDTGQFYKVTNFCFSKQKNISFKERIYLVIRLLFLYRYDKSVKKTMPIARYEERVKILQEIVYNSFYISESRLQNIFVKVFELKMEEDN